MSYLPAAKSGLVLSHPLDREKSKGEARLFVVVEVCVDGFVLSQV
jgi:hypothetical protein